MGELRVDVRLLGPVEADVGGVAADLGGPRQRAVLALLLAARGEVVSVDRLIDDLWRGEPPPRATGALQAYVSNLRRALEPARSPRTPSRRLISAPPGYAVRFTDDEVDAWHAEALLRRAAECGDPRATVAMLTDALGCWRGPALAEFATEAWAAPEAARLDELRMVARERLVQAQIEAGTAAEAALGAEALVRDASLREEGWRLLALSQYVSGRQAEALATLRRARALLAEELGIDPGPRLAELEQAVLTQSVQLPRSAPAAPSVVIEPTPEPAEAFGLIGREAELQSVRTSAESARPGAPVVVLVAGEAGGGKSTLLGRLGADLDAAGWRVLVGRCPESEGGPPAWAWTEALRTLARHRDPGPYADTLAPLLSDGLDAPPTPEPPADALVGRYRLHRAVAGWLGALPSEPLAILLDDVHRADTETRALLASLLDQGLPGRLIVIAAYRPETSDGDGLADLLARLAPHDPLRLRLGGLDRDAAARLIASITGSEPAPDVVDALTERTDGNPFYLKESARLLASEGALVATSQVPEGVRDVLRRRLSRLPEETVSTLRLASVLGRDVDVALLTSAAELDEGGVLDALEVGVISGLLVEPRRGAVRFSHLLVRETLYAGIPQVRRVRWHARVASAVADLYPGDLASLAHHSAQAATPATARQAVQWSVAAAELAESRYAFDTAADLYRQAARCLDLSPDASPSQHVDVLSRLQRALVRSGSTAAALEARKHVIDVAERSGDDRLLVDALTAWNVPTPWANRAYQQVDDHMVGLERRLLRSERLTRAERIRLLCVLVRETSYSEDAVTAAAAAEAVELARAEGDPELLGLALMAMAEVYVADVQWAKRRQLAQEVLDLGREHGLVVYEVLGHVLVAQSACAALDLDEARRHVDRARELARQYQMSQAVVVTMAMEAMLAHLRGDLATAEATYLRVYEEQTRLGGVDAESQLLLALVTVRFSEGRIGEMVDVLQPLYDHRTPVIGDGLALALVEAGRPADEARPFLRDLPPLVVDYLYTIFLTLRGFAVAAIGDAERAGAVYDELLPFRHGVGGGGTSGFVLNPTARALGRLALVLGRPDDAQEHFLEALDVAKRCGSTVWQAQAEADLALVDCK